MSRCSSEMWKPELPWVLLGLRTTPQDVGDHAPAKRVYGDSLTVPADFFRQSDDLPVPALRERLSQFIPCRQTYNTSRSSYLPRDLMEASHIFVRTDAAKPPLTQPYTGPYSVAEEGRSFRIEHQRSSRLGVYRPFEARLSTQRR